MTAIKIYNVLQGFRAGRRTGTAALEAKLIQQLTAMRELVFFKFFLEIHNAYDDLDWDRCLEILVVYGVCPRKIRLLWTYWYRLTVVDRAGGYFGLPFKS